MVDPLSFGVFFLMEKSVHNLMLHRAKARVISQSLLRSCIVIAKYRPHPPILLLLVSAVAAFQTACFMIL